MNTTAIKAMSDFIKVKWDDREVKKAFQKLEHDAGSLPSVLRGIGEDLTESTKKRFETKTAPDGTDWTKNSEVTQWAPKKLPMGGYEIKGRDDPLIDHSALSETINHQLIDSNTLVVGSPMVYAAMQQFGGTKSEFQQLWGDIPGRPFLGVSDDDELAILNAIDNHLKNI